MESLSEPLAKLDEIIASVELVLARPANTNELSGQETAISTSPATTVVDDTGSKKLTAANADGARLARKPETEKNVKKEKSAKPLKVPQQPPIPDTVAQFLLCDLRVGRIESVGHHEEADGLYVLKIDVGEGEIRTVCAGLRKYVPDAEMEGRLVVLICNLKPRKLRGIDSEAMCLAGSVVSGDGQKETVVPISPAAGAKAGSLVSVTGIEQERNVVEGKFLSAKNWDKVVSRLRVIGGKACYDGQRLITECSDVVCDLPDGAEIH
jgi:methionine--tRNA ligase beta chain